VTDDTADGGPEDADDTGGRGPEAGDDTADGGPADVPTLTCSRCNRSWELAYELDELQVGNRAVEQFALDHRRHTGHYPDGVTPWIADCQQCPETEQFLAERPAERFARTHSRHTGHTVELHPPEDDPSFVCHKEG
jgi:hypothetical protein